MDRAWKDLTSEVDFGPRVPGSRAHNDCRDYIFQELSKSCQNVRLQQFKHLGLATGQPLMMENILADQNWKGAKVKVALLAHWDSRPTADLESDPEKRKTPIPGANDGASGVAVLLELARVFKVSPAKVGVEYVFLDGGDLGPGLDQMFLGARLFAHVMTSEKPDYAILLDMVGKKDLVVPKELNSAQYAPSVVKALYAFAAGLGLGDTFPDRDGPRVLDDHLALASLGVPAVDLIDFNYAPLHRLDDTPDKCSPQSLDKVGHLLEEWLRKPDPFKP